ncbi:MAG: carbohydrate ABC transporter permease [Oscillospiraceae bacterium]
MRRTAGDKTFDIVNYFLLIVIAFITLYPFYYVIIQSFSEGLSAMTDKAYFWPKSFTLENYQAFFRDAKWMKGLFVSVARTVIGTVVGVMFTCIVAYALSFPTIAFRKVYMTILLIAMYFSGGIIPTYMLLKGLRLLDSFWVYIVPGALNIFFVMIAISFFQEIPRDIFESAQIDGASEATVFWKIALPVSKPILATIALFVGVNHWNAWFDAAFYIQNKDLKTMAFLMMEVINKNQVSGALAGAAAGRASNTITSFALQSAAMVVAVVPIICVYPFLQRYFVKGMMIGSVKG